jgi:plasmid stabilization system protein ParE
MKRAFASVLVVAFVTMAVPKPLQPPDAVPREDLPILQGSTYLGVVFPADRAHEAAQLLGLRIKEYWTPTAVDVARCESTLRKALEAAAENPELLDASVKGHQDRRDFVAREIRSILAHLPEYRRQYVGIIPTRGVRRILMNSFPGHGPKADDQHPRWRHEIVVVEDGGYSYWRLQYDVATGTYLEFDSNGYA